LSRRFDHHFGGLLITQNHCNPVDKKWKQRPRGDRPHPAFWNANRGNPRLMLAFQLFSKQVLLLRIRQTS
jgi:hypothetical protein